jgi:hypothetical protein
MGSWDSQTSYGDSASIYSMGSIDSQEMMALYEYDHLMGLLEGDEDAILSSVLAASLAI